MGLRIGTQTRSGVLFAQRQLAQHTEGVGRALERLSSGRRIVRASDGAAELALSEKFRAQRVGLARERLNHMDALSRAQVGDAGLEESSGLLIRVRELAVQAANGTLDAEARRMVGDEAEALLDEVDRIARITGFGDQKLLDGSAGTEGFDATRAGLGLQGIEIGSDAESAADAFVALDDALDEVSRGRAGFGTQMNVLESRIRQTLVEEENVQAAESRIADADMAETTAELAKGQILQQTTMAVLAQERVQDEIVLKLIETATDAAKAVAER